MKKYSYDDMTKGWFIGNFEPTVYKTNDFEVAVKYYKKGDYEQKHYHKIATEITMIVSGSVEICSRRFDKGSIVTVEPGEIIDFLALTDVITVVIKFPSIKTDKYIK